MKAIKRGGILLAALVAVSSAFTGAASADVAPTPRPHHSATAQLTPLTRQNVAPDAAVTCTVGQVRTDRTSSCASGGLRVDFYIEPEHQYQGSADFAWTSNVQLDARNRHRWTDKVTLRLLSTTVAAAELGVATITETCGHCTATGGTPQITTLGTTRNWDIVIDSPGAVTNTDAQAPHLTYEAAPYTPVSIDLGPKLDVRCDNTPRMSPAAAGGCVYPDYTPTYDISVTGPFDQVAWHIDWAQHNLKNHWGWQGHGPALTRTMDQALIRANRRTACPSSIPRPPGKSCDEYPFASTHQGASVNPDFSCHMVPAAQNRLEGRARQSWYNTNRLLENDKFWVNVTNIPTVRSDAAMRPLVQCP
ncbi:NucA/NucB deoxyribonuclease domain-containing protein [Streptomyces sp. NPDC001691]|uniref:NucA/NucB deoxyribonuclease domain-containing protein n=1 Tax=Streptomyces sp. NPDC001691 TaxID=3364600 RepID=UPI0036B844B8